MCRIYCDYILQAAWKILEKNFEIDVDKMRQYIFKVISYK